MFVLVRTPSIHMYLNMDQVSYIEENTKTTTRINLTNGDTIVLDLEFNQAYWEQAIKEVFNGF